MGNQFDPNSNHMCQYRVSVEHRHMLDTGYVFDEKCLCYKTSSTLNSNNILDYRNTQINLATDL